MSAFTASPAVFARKALNGSALTSKRVAAKNVKTFAVSANAKVDACDKNSVIVSPSILSANFATLGAEVRARRASLPPLSPRPPSRRSRVFLSVPPSRDRSSDAFMEARASIPRSPPRAGTPRTLRDRIECSERAPSLTVPRALLPRSPPRARRSRPSTRPARSGSTSTSWTAASCRTSRSVPSSSTRFARSRTRCEDPSSRVVVVSLVFPPPPPPPPPRAARPAPARARRAASSDPQPNPNPNP
eukprot:31260-Pelagococcus_subviridis.AAC.5